MACGCFLERLLVEFPFWWIPAWTVHLLLHSQLGGYDGIHTLQRNQITVARGICTLTYFHILHPKCQCIAAPPDRNRHNTKSAECRSPWPIGHRGLMLHIQPHCLMVQSESAAHNRACHLLEK